MREWIPVPGSVRARLLEAALARFEAEGYEAAAVTAIARDADTTTGALYHHFGSKLGLFVAIREEMERRVRDRVEGAVAAIGGGRDGLVAGLLVGFDAAIRFGAARILSDPAAPPEHDALGPALRVLAAPAPAAAVDVLLGAWRAGLLAVADGASPADVRAALAWALAGG